MYKRTVLAMNALTNVIFVLQYWIDEIAKRSNCREKETGLYTR